MALAFNIDNGSFNQMWTGTKRKNQLVIQQGKLCIETLIFVLFSFVKLNLIKERVQYFFIGQTPLGPHSAPPPLPGLVCVPQSGEVQCG